MGDLLFVLVNLARFVKVDPEQALRRTNAKFRQRFAYIERKLAERGREAGGFQHRRNGGAVAGSQAVIEIRQLFQLAEFEEVLRLQQSHLGLRRYRTAAAALSGGGEQGGRPRVRRLRRRHDGGVLFRHSGHQAGRRGPICTATCWACCRHIAMPGIGRRLKLRQREEALARGIELIEWTFDPLELKNAFFNIERLGAIVRRYSENQYGVTASPLHGGLPTDRCIAEWWIAIRRACGPILAGETVVRRASRSASSTPPISRGSAAKTRPRARNPENQRREVSSAPSSAAWR